eukprot:scaffold1395_cov397-Prasinococcus_capsulatus_cf.AAC.5
MGVRGCRATVGRVVHVGTRRGASTAQADRREDKAPSRGRSPRDGSQATGVLIVRWPIEGALRRPAPCPYGARPRHPPRMPCYKCRTRETARHQTCAEDGM